MLRALTLAAALAFCAGTAFAQTSYPLPQDNPSAGQDGGPPASPAPGAQGYQPTPAWGPGMAGHVPADPQTRALRQAQRSACAADMAKACASVDPSDHRAMHQCMKANRATFSPMCQTAISNLQAYRRQMRAQAGATSPLAPSPDGFAPQ